VTRLQWLGIVGVLALSGAVLGYGALFDEETPYLVARGEAIWIAPPSPVDTAARRVGPGHAQAAAFEAEFQLAAGERLELEARALGSLRVFLGGEIVVPAARSGDEDGAFCLKRICRASVDHSAGLVTVRAEVRNEAGPPLLWLELAASSTRLATDLSWRVAPLRDPSSSYPVERADDTRLLPETLAIEGPLAALRRHAVPLMLGFALAAGASLAAQRRDNAQAPWRAAWLPWAALGAVALFWMWIFAAKLASMPLRTGFDVQGHLEYVRFLLQHHALPTAADGWSMYHPPAFYAAVAALVALFDPVVGGVGERISYRLLPALGGLGHAAVALGIALCVAVAGLLPLNLYMAAYFSNESGHAIVFAIALWLALRAMTEGGLSAARSAALVVSLGLALLSKFTALGLVPIVCFFVGFERWQARGLSFARAFAPALGLGAGAVAIGGWFYAGNWLVFGEALVWNFDRVEGTSYWSLPGFHTGSYFTSFGTALVHPYYASFASLWDGVYSTLWGDGLVAGFTSYAARPVAWQASWMTAGYALALPLTAAALVGWAALVRDSLLGSDRTLRCALALLTTLLFFLGLSTVWASFTAPHNGAARASYSLALVAPFAFALVRGLGVFDAGLAKLPGLAAQVGRAALHGALAIWALAVVLTYGG
jgi:hypothetical protein